MCNGSQPRLSSKYGSRRVFLAIRLSVLDQSLTTAVSGEIGVVHVLQLLLGLEVGFQLKVQLMVSLPERN